MTYNATRRTVGVNATQQFGSQIHVVEGHGRLWETHLPSDLIPVGFDRRVVVGFV